MRGAEGVGGLTVVEKEDFNKSKMKVDEKEDFNKLPMKVDDSVKIEDADINVCVFWCALRGADLHEIPPWFNILQKEMSVIDEQKLHRHYYSLSLSPFWFLKDFIL